MSWGHEDGGDFLSSLLVHTRSYGAEQNLGHKNSRSISEVRFNRSLISRSPLTFFWFWDCLCEADDFAHNQLEPTSRTERKLLQRHREVRHVFRVTHRCWFGWLGMLGCGICWGGGCDTLICVGCIWCIVWGWSIFFRLSIVPAVWRLRRKSSSEFHFLFVSFWCRCTKCTIHCTTYGTRDSSRFFSFLFCRRRSLKRDSHFNWSYFKHSNGTNWPEAQQILAFEPLVEQQWKAIERDEISQLRKSKIWLTFYNIE